MVELRIEQANHLTGHKRMGSNTQLSDEAQHLAMVPLFRQLDEDDLAKLAEEVDQVFFKSGEAIFHEYDQGDALPGRERRRPHLGTRRRRPANHSFRT